MRREQFALLVLLLAMTSTFAGVYTPDDPCPFNVKPDGTAEPLPHRLFVALMVDRLAPRVPNSPDPPGIPDWAYDGNDAQATYSARLGQLLAARWTKAQQLAGDDLAGHTAALLRYNAPQQAINLLDRGRVGRSYVLKANRIHAFATLRQWTDAASNPPDIPDVPPPPPAGTTPEQFRWQLAVDQSAYLRWLELHDADVQKWKALSETHPDTTPLAVFTTRHGDPIHFWVSAEATTMLPADAVAVVQQLLLWAPWDDRLLWTLAEVYYATGKVREAHSVYKMLVLPAETNEGRGYRGPRLLGDHVKRVGAEFAKLPQEESVVSVLDPAPAPPPPDPGLFGLIDPTTFYVACTGFGVLVVLMAVLQLRAILSRRAGAGRKSARTSS